MAHRDRAVGGEIDAYSLEKRYIKKDGSPVWAHVTVSVVRTPTGEPKYIISIVEDIDDDKRAERDRRALEAKVLQAQKLESLGILAGGIAHDFNNLLTAILGNAGLAVHSDPGGEALEHLRNIESAGARAAELTQQLLAYAGKGRFVVETVDLNDLIRNMQPLLRTAVSSGTLIHYELCEEPALVEADAAQIRQVVMNLVTNASEALEDESGSVTISTGFTHTRSAIDGATANSLPEGVDCIDITVADTGSGMDRQTTEKIFDPFFTTKFTGRGLGLAAVLGIVNGHRGAIRVDSVVGRGTSITIHLPQSDAVRSPDGGSRSDSEALTGRGTVLVVDDELIVGEVSGAMLRKLGFRPFVVGSGREALEAVELRREEIVAILLDLTMPEMGGVTVFGKLREFAPDIPVILMSGYNEQEATQRFVGQKLAGFLHKPFKPDDLHEKLREALGRG